MTQAMRDKNVVKLSVLRLAKAAIMKFEVAGSKKVESTDEDVLKILAKEIKQRKDSIEAYKKGDREEQAASEEAEMKILQSYLPEQMSEEELKSVVSRVISQTGATSKADFGKVMGAVMKEVKGKADGRAVSKAVEETLS